MQSLNFDQDEGRTMTPDHIETRVHELEQLIQAESDPDQCDLYIEELDRLREG